MVSLAWELQLHKVHMLKYPVLTHNVLYCNCICAAALLMWFYNVLCTLGPLLPICWRKAIGKNVNADQNFLWPIFYGWSNNFSLFCLLFLVAQADRMIGASFVNFKPMSKDPVKVGIPFHQLIFSRGYLILVVTLATENKRMRMSSWGPITCFTPSLT